jgi:uncharacterized coiled-coil protein SlyX
MLQTRKASNVRCCQQEEILSSPGHDMSEAVRQQTVFDKMNEMEANMEDSIKALSEQVLSVSNSNTAAELSKKLEELQLAVAKLEDRLKRLEDGCKRSRTTSGHQDNAGMDVEPQLGREIKDEGALVGPLPLDELSEILAKITQDISKVQLGIAQMKKQNEN